MKKAPSVVSSCNSKKNITVSTWEAPFNKGLGSQKHVNMNGTIIFIHTMIRLIFLPRECYPWCSFFNYTFIIQLTNTIIVVNGKPLTWISFVLLLLLRSYGLNGVMFLSCHHKKNVSVPFCFEWKLLWNTNKYFCISELVLLSLNTIEPCLMGFQIQYQSKAHSCFQSLWQIWHFLKLCGAF